MSKHNKTRSQKKISDLRRKLQSMNNYSLENNVITEKKLSRREPLKPKINYQFENTNVKTLNYNDTTYLVSDLLKTGFLTAVIIVFQLLLFFLLKNHVIALPIAGF